MAHPQANGQMEVTNRTMFEGIKKRLEGSTGKCVEELDTVLWPYRTSSRMATSETPFTLVYGGEVVIPTEIIIDSFRIEAYQEKANAISRREELDLVRLKERSCPGESGEV